MNDDLLLLSNSSIHGRGYLEHALNTIQEFLGARTTVHFAPYALKDHDGYTQKVSEALGQLGVDVTGLHATTDARAALTEAEVLFIGGGNSFRLAKTLQDQGLREVIRDQVAAGRMSYMGSSAGTNMSCPTLRTTNDMPIVEPRSFATLGMLPFQINPHYLDPDPASTHMGETREERIAQFLEENDVAVLGMREGSWLRRRGTSLELGGTTGARLFMRGEEPREFKENDDLSFLLKLTPRFD
jgi:dipeptidase E